MFLPGSRRCGACDAKSRFAALPGVCLPYLTLLRQMEKHRQPSTWVGLNSWPPGCLKQRADIWAVPGPALQWHRGPEAVSGRAVAIRHTNGATAHLQTALKISAG